MAQNREDTMKKTLLAALVALAPALPAFAADAAWGMWKTQPDDGSYAYVELSSCNGGHTCGWLRRTFNDSGEYQSENIGKVLVIDMQNQGDSSYKGSVWRPSNDKTYIGKMTLNGDTIDLAGCVLGGLFCSSQTWTRIK
jgi:uncharacterized protein (DUF2147 family)